jgi:hypothetical protein
LREKLSVLLVRDVAPKASDAAERLEAMYVRKAFLLVRDVVPKASDAAERLEAMYVRKALCPTCERCSARGQ